MEQHLLGRTGRLVSVVGLGTWQLGTDWGEVTEADAHAVLDAAVADGVTFVDTADVYGDGRSEQLVGSYLAQHPDAGITVATKMGRRVEQRPEEYTLDAFRRWTDRSRTNLRTDRLDLVQLHCPPSEVIDSDATYDALDALVDDGAIAAYGVSVETVDQALAAIARPHVATVQIILNAFRLKPLDRVLPAASAAGVGVIARVPLASGLLSGRYTKDTTFAESDHRTYNRDGQAFDVGETFSGVPFDVGVEAAQEFAALVDALAARAAAARADGSGAGGGGAGGGEDGGRLTPAQAAIAWAWQQPGVSTVIPGARDAAQVHANAAAGAAPVLGPSFEQGVRAIYDARLRALVHDRW